MKGLFGSCLVILLLLLFGIACLLREILRCFGTGCFHVDQLSGCLILEVLRNSREGGWYGSQVGKNPICVSASDSFKRENSR